MNNLYAQEQWVNSSEGYRTGDSGVYETFTDNRGELFRAMRREYGRCISLCYINTADGPKAIGWVFQKRVKYDDCNETFLLETWVTVHESEPEHCITYHYA